MPFFRTTDGIFKTFEEHFDPNWMDSDKIITPETKEWDYKRELTVEDVDLWEVIIEHGWKVYAAWSPYAEFYLIVPPYWIKNTDIETYYGAGASKKVIKRLKELGIPYRVNTVWVKEENAWLYQ